MLGILILMAAAALGLGLAVYAWLEIPSLRHGLIGTLKRIKLPARKPKPARATPPPIRKAAPPPSATPPLSSEKSTPPPKPAAQNIPTKKRRRTGWIVAGTVIAVVVIANATKQSPRSKASSRGVPTTPTIDRASERTAERSISDQRQAYSRTLRNSSDRSRRVSESERRRISDQLRALSFDIAFSRARRPSKPRFIVPRLARDDTQQYLRELSSWSDSHLALLRKHCDLERQLVLLTSDGSGSTRNLLENSVHSAEITHLTDRPNSRIPFSSDPAVAEYASAVNRADEIQWNLEGEVLKDRRAQLARSNGTRSTTTTQAETDHQVAADRFYYVHRIIDGDTLEINGATIRLLNIDTPERGQYGYDRATAELKRLVQGRRIKLEFANSAEATRDRFNRVLAFVFVDDKFVNYEMIRSGWSSFYTAYGQGRYAEALRYAESEARRMNRGLHR